MGLDEEVRKLIEEKQAKLASSDSELSGHFAGQAERFKPLQAVLERAVKAIGPQFVKASFNDGKAYITIGRKDQNGYFEADVDWEIQPNYEFPDPDNVLEEMKNGKSPLKGVPGFRIDEVTHYRNSESTRNVHKFDSDAQTVKYVIEAMTDLVAKHQHNAEIRNRNS